MAVANAYDIAGRVADGGPVRGDGRGGFMVRCPAHDDSTASLHVSPGKDQPVVLKCFASCTRDEILAASGLTLDDISNPLDPRNDGAEEWTPRGPAVAVYSYADEHGGHLFDVCRTADKQFPCRVKDPSTKSGYAWRLGDTRRVLYRLGEVIAAVTAGREIWVCEGEKDALALCGKGVCATTSPGGAGKWREEYSPFLRDATVTVVADRDAPGQAHARMVRESLMLVGARVRIVEAHNAGGKDAGDHFTAGYGLVDFVVTTPYEGAAKLLPGLDVDAYLDRQFPPRRFVIEGTLARGEVLGVTGYEGHGKSTLLKQIAVQIAYGQNPFTLRRMTPRKVLFIDCENDEQDNVEDFRGLVRIAGINGIKSPGAPLWIIDSGAIDLATDTSRAWLLERVTAYQPDVLIIGPIYNMIGREIKGEDDARILKDALDAARLVNGCAVIWEHHVPHEGAQGRGVRPIGSSLLMRWPSFGFGLKPTDAQGVYDWEAWRGARRRSRHWPERLVHGTGPADWPWVEGKPVE